MTIPIPEQTTDLIQRCRAGDEDAWAHLVDQYSGLVIAVARRYALTTDEVDDVYQTVFATLVRRLPTIREPEALPKWVLTTTTRTALRVRSTNQRHRSLHPEADPDRRLQPDSDPVLKERRAVGVRRALLHLDPLCRELITTLFLKCPRPDYGTVSAELGIPVGSIGPTRARCLTRLAALLAGDPLVVSRESRTEAP